MIAGIIVQSVDVYNAMITGEEAKEKKQKVLEAKSKELLEMTKLVMPEEVEFKESNEDESIQVKKLARIQRKLEMYAYTHKKDVAGLSEHVKAIDRIEKTRENKERLLKEINDIQTKYKIFGRYVQDEELEELYKVKFNILTMDINKQKESPLKEISNEKELKCYEKIVERKIEKIIQGTNPQLKEAFGEEKLRSAVSMINKVLKGGQRIFQIDKILQDRTLLNLILAFDNSNSLERISLDKQNVYTKLYEDIFEWESQIPLKSIFELRELENRPITGKDDLYLILYNMYNEYYVKNNDIKEPDEIEDEYGRVSKLPEGITRIKSRDLWTMENRYSMLMNNILEESYKIICPSTLKVIENSGFKGCSYLHEIELNEGLEEIGDEAFYGCRTLGEYVPIKMPSTLRTIGKKSFFNCYNLHIILNEGLKRVGDYAFNIDSFWKFREFSYGTPQNKLHLPSSVEEVGKKIANILLVDIIKDEERIRTLINVKKEDLYENTKKRIKK